MAKSLSSLIYCSELMAISTTTKALFISKPKHLLFHNPFFSSTSTSYPLQYDLILNRPSLPTRRNPTPAASKPESRSDPVQDPSDSEMGIDSWAEKKLSSDMDKSKRKYYSKRRKRMYGTDSDEENERKSREEGFVELRPEVVEFHRLHKREEELYFYDAFAYPWEKNKHYKMVHQLEKKYFPDQCLDKAFLDPKDSIFKQNNKGIRSGGLEDKKLVFFDQGKSDSNVDKDGNVRKDENVGVNKDVTERKVEEFFKSLKKVSNKESDVGSGEPFLVATSTQLPPRWDGPFGTVVLVDKPKGWTSFTVCGKLRRLVKVKKVGHAGTLDPMATGLLIVCVGKATKVVDRYQGMIKGYSGVFRLGEATSTWDADSPVSFYFFRQRGAFFSSSASAHLWDSTKESS